MKPFNYEEFKAGRPAISAYGRKVFFVGIDPQNPDKMVAKLENCAEYEQYSLDGVCTNGGGLQLKRMAPVKKKMWLSVDASSANGGGSMLTTRAYDHPEAAKMSDSKWQLKEVEVDV